MIQRDLAFFFVLSLCFVMGVVLFGFWLHHMYLIYYNFTTNERMKRIDLEIAVMEEQITEIDPYANPYDKGFIGNLREVIFANAV